MPEPLTFKEAALKILSTVSGPVEASEITRLALQQNLLATSGKTPENTMAAMLYMEAKRPNGLFLQAEVGAYHIN